MWINGALFFAFVIAPIITFIAIVCILRQGNMEAKEGFEMLAAQNAQQIQKEEETMKEAGLVEKEWINRYGIEEPIQRWKLTDHRWLWLIKTEFEPELYAHVRIVDNTSASKIYRKKCKHKLDSYTFDLNGETYFLRTVY
jgi:hypothetical protein